MTRAPAEVQLSVATSPDVKLGTTAWHEALAKADCAGGQVIIEGGVLSDTVNVVEQVAELLAASFTVITTVVVPRPAVDPAAGTCVKTSEPAGVQLSVAITPPVKTGRVAWQLPSANAVWGAAQVVITGGILSDTVKVAEQVDELLEASLTVRTTVVTPGPTMVPAAGAWETTSDPAAVQLSEATRPVVNTGTAAWQDAFAKAVCGPGQVIIVGGVLSVTVNVVAQVVVLPAASLTVMMTEVAPSVTVVPAAGACVMTNDPDAVQLSVATTAGIKLGRLDWHEALANPL